MGRLFAQSAQWQACQESGCNENKNTKNTGEGTEQNWTSLPAKASKPVKATKTWGTPVNSSKPRPGLGPLTSASRYGQQNGEGCPNDQGH